MNVDSSMCASSGSTPHWNQIDWPQSERHVRRLQARIVKATREGHWSKVKSLQWLCHGDGSLAQNSQAGRAV
jgi:hypothetical protein